MLAGLLWRSRDLDRSMLPESMEPVYESVFITGAANTVVQSVVWFVLSSENSGEVVKADYVAYALCNQVAVASVLHKQVLFTLRPEHQEDRINAVCHVQYNEGCVYILSAGDKGFINIWQITHDSTRNVLQQRFVKSLASEGKSMSSISAVLLNNRLSVVAADTVGSLFLWESDGVQGEHATWQLSHTLRFPTAQMPNTLAMHRLTSHASLVAVGSVDARIHMFVLHALTGLSAVGHLTGHEEWITSLSLTSAGSAPASSSSCSSSSPAASTSASPPVFLASASQDNKIRVWKIWTSEAGDASNPNTSNPNAASSLDHDDEDDDDNMDETAVTLAYDDSDAMEKSEAKASFCLEQQVYYVSLEGLLLGHEDWVTSVCWDVSATTAGSSSPPQRLFSTSMDRNMILWELDAGSLTYSPATRVGDMGGALGGSVGGNLLGFVAGTLSSCGSYLCGIGYGGSFHLWQHDVGTGRWQPVKFLSGHFNTVEDVVYDPHQGGYVVTVSHDQTCRIFAPTFPTKTNASSSSSSVPQRRSYHEVSRPQIHGYDLNCLVLSYGNNTGDDDGVHTYSILTGGEEKVIRVFEMPKIVFDGLQTLCHLPLNTHVPLVQQAYIPELGLSNKGREHATQQEVKDLLARGVSDIDWSVLPLESQLADFTLWIEVEKLYGHHNDVLCMGLSYDGQYMVSSSKARYGQDSTALLLLWRLKTHNTAPSDTNTNNPPHTSYEVVQALPGNTSTVVCLQFSRHNQYLATGSKDRKLCVYVCDALTGAYANVLVVSSAHKRIIWDVCWHPNNELLVTVSRDGAAKIWQLTCTDNTYNIACVQTITTPQAGPLTSVCIHQSGIQYQDKANVSAVLLGGEDGHVYVYVLYVENESYEMKLVYTLPSEFAHTKTVKKIKCRPGAAVEGCVDFVTCGDDHTVRIHKLSF